MSGRQFSEAALAAGPVAYRRETSGVLAALALGALWMIGAVHPAQAAAPAAPPRSTAVQLADLDLSRAEHVELLYRRIQRAAHKVCTQRDRHLYLQVARSRGGCYRRTLDAAIAQANLPGLSSLHSEAIQVARSR